MINNVDEFINNLAKDKEGHTILNMFDNSILHTSFLESALRCSAPGRERKPETVRYVKNQNPWNGITVFTDKVFHLARQVDSKIKVAWIIEPYDLVPPVYEQIKALEGDFDFIFTYEQSLLDRDPKKYKFIPCDTSGVEAESHKLHKKTKLVSMVYSDKTWLFGHKLRHIIAKTLIPKIGYEEVDFFGRGTSNPIELKTTALNDYMFNIAIENAQRPNYFADKIYDCFVCGTVPIYWGAPNVKDYFDERGILQFTHPDELTDILNSLSEEKYLSMYEGVKNNFELVKQYLRPDDLLLQKILQAIKDEKDVYS